MPGFPSVRPASRVRLPLLGCLVLAAALTAPAAEPPLSFNRHIQPILSDKCYACHGPDAATREADLRLDRFEFATVARGTYDAAIVPGKPLASPVIERILAEDPDDRMPPKESHKSLSAAEVDLLKRWIAEGAAYEEHWSLIAPARPAVPAAGRGWARNPVDAFIADSLARAGLRPSPEEAPARLLRRVTLDLTGLPPSPAEIDAFLADRRPDAYERVVDRLLGSVASAEHFARHWLDAARYADTHGIHIDNYRSIWPYRDWVVDAFHRNLPFDQFSIEQLAGDLLPDASLDQKVATGFNRCLPTTSEGGAIDAEYEAIYAKDRVETFSTIWLGLTTGCAACHDHKFDPVTAKDFYSLTAFFRHNTMPAMDGNLAETRPTLVVPTVADRVRWAQVQEELARVDQEVAARLTGTEGDAAFRAWLPSVRGLTLPPASHAVRRHLPLIVAPAAAPAPNAGPQGEVIDGPFGPAAPLARFSGVLGPALPLARDSAFTLTFWLRLTGTPTAPLLASRSPDPAGAGWSLTLEKGKLVLQVDEGRGGPPLVRSEARQAVAPDAWHTVSLFFEGSGAQNRILDVRLNGRDVANAGGYRSFPSDILPSGPLVLGEASPGGPAVTGVWIQDLRLIDEPISVADLDAFAGLSRAYAATKSAARDEAGTARLWAHFFDAVDQPSRQLQRRRDDLLAEARAIRRRGGVTLVMEEKTFGSPHAYVLNRGEYSQPGERVPAATPAVLPPLPPDAPPNRLALARWLFTPEHPLTARVTVNRVWQQLFGLGLVESTGDFGVTGDRPSHPELLDWLAVEFRESGWDHRGLVRLLVTTAAYRQSAAASPELLERDPANRLLARGPRHRLDAEVIRDQALAASGLLVPRVGGPPVRPYQPEGIWEEVAMKESTTRFYRPDRGESLYRRSLYTFWKRIAPPPAMDILNAPSREVSCVRRDRTNTPLQALVTLNEPLFVEAARQLAAAALGHAPATEARLGFIATRLLGRPLSGEEAAVVRRFLDAALAHYASAPAEAAALLRVGDSPPDAGLPPAELAAWTLVASQLLNLDEALTK